MDSSMVCRGRPLSTTGWLTDHVAIDNDADDSRWCPGYRSGMANVDLRRLRYFVAVAEERHFGRAAARLHMSAPPLSQRIRELEAELGLALFERSSRSVKLTPAGERLLGDARAVLIAVDRFEQSAEQLTLAGGRPRVRLLPRQRGRGDAGPAAVPRRAARRARPPGVDDVAQHRRVARFGTAVGRHHPRPDRRRRPRRQRAAGAGTRRSRRGAARSPPRRGRGGRRRTTSSTSRCSSSTAATRPRPTT